MHGIPNIAWKEGQCAAHIGIPKGRCLPFRLGIETRLSG